MQANLPVPYRRTIGETSNDGIEVAEIVRILQLQWRAVFAFLGLGIVAALLIVLFAPRRFDGKATLLARAATGENGGSILGRLTSIGGLMSGGSFGGLPSPFESELQVLRSRSVAGWVVDSLELQFSVREPARHPPAAFIASSDLPGRFKPRTYTFDRTSDGSYQIRDGDRTFTLKPGQPGDIGIGSVTLRPGGLPPRLKLKVYDREDAITRLSKRLEANKAGGEVAGVRYRGEDSITAAQVPNLVVAYYLERRKTVDRGINQRRLEYVTQQYEATARELSETERALRAQQEASGVLDAEIEGEAWIEGVVTLRESLTSALVDESSISDLLERAESGRIPAKQLAAYPNFMRGTPIASLGDQITQLESQKLRLLERRTERDPEVVVLSQNITALEGQILGMARSYLGSVRDQRVNLEKQLDSLQRKLMALPAAAERGGRLQRDVIRLTSIHTALQAQLVEARLAAIGEGGDVRQIDAAVPPRKPAFPQPVMTMGIGTIGGLIAGSIAALLMAWFGRWLRDPIEIERATGVVAQRLDASSPLVISGIAPRTVLLLPLEAGAKTGPVAHRLAHTAAARAVTTQVLDLSMHGNGNGAGAPESVASLIARHEAETGMLIVQLPGVNSDAAVAAMRENRPVILVAPPGPVNRARLGGALEMLRRLDVPCAGVVISEPTSALRA